MASQQTGTPPPSVSTPSPSPFDSPRADVVLRSSEGTDFRMLQTFLAWSSPVFDGMFSLPQPAGGDTINEQQDGLPVVQLAETGAVLDILLRFCMPQAPPAVTNIKLALGVREAARKYEVAWAARVAGEAIDTLTEKDPLRMYAIACQSGLQGEARKAAMRCLRLPLAMITDSQVEEIEEITVRQFRRLVRYRQRCRDAVEKQVPSSAYYALYGLPSCAVSGEDKRKQCGEWFDKWVHKVVEELKECTWGGQLKVEDATAAYIANMPCQKCRSYGFADAQRSVTAAALATEREIAKIQLEWS
ncbi:hypothetical protein PsYK624_068160 [Phanerochaete sordida]|uniref:BTB domain-containing protein n=1 Tax=Phanerochaete sordida TaxID=48140 RepID=A0A9P3LE71_9APHY|nr:hypothetical protein PsYK624_068160 [Phanerochaete sordida]